MKKHRTVLLAAALMAASSTVHASQTLIKVWTDVDTTLALLRADGSTLPDAVQLTHNPNSGLVPWTEQVRIYSNDIRKDVEVRLSSPPALTSLDSTAPAVPLSVSLNAKALTTAAQDFTADELFDGALPGASIAMPLTITQTTQAPISKSGTYEGLISIVMAQKTAAP